MTQNEVADALMKIVGFDQTEPRLVEVEAGTHLNQVEVEDDLGNRFVITVDLA